ncbi:hypothetical protein MKEN_01346700 [Mycena kentingensis (nom. inval.)]|nr:hypothetical protein MKEN_01346700 [Mycena kentingensis (nom. inval.)]
MKLHRGVVSFDNDGKPFFGPFVEPGRRVVIWYHDESIFYAHDRRRKSWFHKDAAAVPYRKGDGASYMVADYFSADFGWLRDEATGRSARACIRPGKNRDGYFSAVEVQQQAETAAKLTSELWPDFDHVFVYDNATTHKKRADGSLSARYMPKFPSKSTSNWLITVNQRDANGKLVYGPTGSLAKEKIRMTGATFADGRPQALYFPNDHPEPERRGMFKGMQFILQERGFSKEADLRAQCKEFKSEYLIDI